MLGAPLGDGLRSLAGLGVPEVVTGGVEERGNGAGSALGLQALTRRIAVAATNVRAHARRPRRTAAVTTQTPPIGFQDAPETGA